MAQPLKFRETFQSLMETMPTTGVFASDNLITWNRNLSFLGDQALMQSLAKNGEESVVRAIVWRTSVLLWAARNGLRRDGDFVECGVWKGTTARVICDALDFNSTGKDYWLYDIFDWTEGDKHAPLDGLEAGLYAKVVKRFEDLPTVHVIKGFVPESFSQGVPDKIALLHLDMNSADAEIAALNTLWDRVVAGGIIVLDDYGWDTYLPTKQAEDKFFAERGYSVLELPTGQGIVFK